MGWYIDWKDVTNRYPSVAKDRGAEQTALGGFIDDAEGEVNARLAPRYSVPFTPGSSNAPPLVRTLAIDLVYYRLNFQQKWSGTLKDYIDARFEGLLNGDISLVTSAGLVDPANVGGAWTSTPYRSSFGTDAPENWSTSCQWKSDQADEREFD